MARTKHPTLPLGVVLGCTTLTSEVLALAAAFAAGIWSDAVAQDFCGDAVATMQEPDSLPDIGSWLPDGTLQEFGLEACPDSRRELVGTYDIDPHQDYIHGLVLFLVLHNDGLTFRQGSVHHMTAPGEFFIFDDRRNHAVKATKRPGAYVGLSVPLRRIEVASAAGR